MNINKDTSRVVIETVSGHMFLPCSYPVTEGNN